MNSRVCFAVCFAVLICGQLSASMVGLDNASASAYDAPGFWENGDNGAISGTPFTGWSLSSSGSNSGHFIGDSTTLASSNSGAEINSSGESFGMFGHSGQFATATRDFKGGPLSVGQTFSADLGVNFRNGNKGINLLNSSGAELVNFNTGNVTGSDDYTVNGSSLGFGFDMNTAFNIRFSQTSLSGGTWEIARSGGLTDVASGTYSGLASGFQFYVSGTDNGAAENNLFFNNLSVTPEPTSLVLFGAWNLMFLIRRRSS